MIDRTPKKSCAYCLEPIAKKSKEHLFLASMGGRRTNTGVMCPSCNQFFSELDAQFDEQIRNFNGFLGVEGDHADAPQVAIMKDEKTGRSFRVHHTGRTIFKGVEHKITEVLGHEQHGYLRAGSLEEAQEYIRKQQEKGVNVKLVGPPRKGNQYFTSDYLVSPFVFGGIDAFRIAGKMIYNCFVDGFQKLSRDIPFDPFRYWVRYLSDQKEGPENQTRNFIVDHGYKLADLIRPFVPTPCPDFCHRIVLVLDRDQRQVIGLIQVFGAISYGAIIARDVELPFSKGIVVTTNPLKRLPDELIREEMKEIPKIDADAIAERMEKSREKMNNAIHELIGKIIERRWGLEKVGFQSKWKEQRLSFLKGEKTVYQAGRSFLESGGQRFVNGICDKMKEEGLSIEPDDAEDGLNPEIRKRLCLLRNCSDAMRECPRNQKRRKHSQPKPRATFSGDTVLSNTMNSPFPEPVQVRRVRLNSAPLRRQLFFHRLSG